MRCGDVPPLAACFTARPESSPGLLDEVVPGSVVALVPAREGGGMPGWRAACGKTQLAVFAAESLWRSKAIDVLVWVTATSRASILAGYAQAAALSGAAPAGDGEPAAVRFTSWLARSERAWLVVLDGLVTAVDADGLWPHGPAGRVVVTTRDRAAAQAGAARLLAVGPFSCREALSYLRDWLTLDPDQRLGAIDLIEDLGREPLALAQAAAVIGSSDRTCRDYQGWFAGMRGQLAAAAGTAPDPAEVTWRLCAERAQRLMPGEPVWPLLALAALLRGQAIPGPVFTSQAACQWLAADRSQAMMDPGHARQVVLNLERVGLLSVDMTSEPPLVRMNQAVAAAIQAVLPSRVLAATARPAADALTQAWPETDADAGTVTALRSCAATLHQAAGDLLWDGGGHRVLWQAGASLHRAGLTGPALAWWHDMTAACQRQLGPAHPDTLAAGLALAEAHLAAGHAMQAITLFEQVQAGRARALGGGHLETISARVRLGCALVSAGQPADAVSVLQDAAAGLERACGSDHLTSVAAREDLAAACLAAGQAGPAIGWYRHALGIRERQQGTRHADTLTTRHQLAAACLAGGEAKDAISHAKKALAGRERVLPPGHRDTIAARATLAAASRAAGHMAAAVALYEQACAESENVLGPDHPATLTRRASLADAYYAVGRLTQARTLMQDTADRCAKVLPPDDPLAQAIRDSLPAMAMAAPGQP